ncbi:hypothetical protein OQA88_3634 [Cercophora sp. LCS_1]
MPGFPPTARSERIADYSRQCGKVQWHEEQTRAADGTRLGLAVATVPLLSNGKLPSASESKTPLHIYILYFQGNASSTPPRLPDISWVLRAVSESNEFPFATSELTFVCLSYRGYWTSSGRPSEKGLRLDAEAGARWIAEHHKQILGKGAERSVPILFLWGQSIGSGVATNLAASGQLPVELPVRGMILETPFTSVRAMLGVLYPQKWLPYKYLWPFLRNQLDSWANLGLIAESTRKGQVMPHIYILEADRDELVPKEHGDALVQRCLDLEIPVEKGSTPVAFHSEAIARAEGKRLAAEAILKLIKQAPKDSVH